MPGYVGRLEPGGTLDAGPYFQGPWRSFERTSLNPGEVLTLTATETEHAVFVMSGAGQFIVGEVTGAFTAGSAYTIGWQASLTLEATTAAEFFVTTLTVPSP